jgi:hypothetical protein
MGDIEMYLKDIKLGVVLILLSIRSSGGLLCTLQWTFWSCRMLLISWMLDSERGPFPEVQRTLSLCCVSSLTFHSILCRIQWRACRAHGRDTKFVQNINMKPERKWIHQTCNWKCEDNINMDRKEIGIEVVDWVQLSQDRSSSGIF